MGTSKLTTARAKARQQAGSFIYAHRLSANVHEMLLARVVAYRDHLSWNPEYWECPEIENFWQTARDADLVIHKYGVSLEGEKDPGLSEYDRPLLSPELHRRGTMAASAALWEYSAGQGFLNVASLSPASLSHIISSTSTYMRAWWVGALRDGDTKEESIARAETSHYCRWRESHTISVTG